MAEELKKNPLNVLGKYFVAQELCLDHACCEHVAPEHFRLSSAPESYGAYVFKQPNTKEEEEKCQEAKLCCPMEAIRTEEEE